MASLQHTLPDPKERIDDPAGSWASKTLSALDDEVPVKTTTTTTTTTKEPLSSSSTGISSTQSSIPSTTNKSTTSPLTAHQPTSSSNETPSTTQLGSNNPFRTGPSTTSSSVPREDTSIIDGAEGRHEATTPGLAIPGSYPGIHVPPAGAVAADLEKVKGSAQGFFASAGETVKSYLPESVQNYLPGSPTASTTLPTTERTNPSTHTATGPLPGSTGEKGVAILPDEKLQSSHPSILKGSSLPTEETGSNTVPRTHDATGPLPGSKNEYGVALLPDEKEPTTTKKVGEKAMFAAGAVAGAGIAGAKSVGNTAYDNVPNGERVKTLTGNAAGIAYEYVPSTEQVKNAGSTVGNTAVNVGSTAASYVPSTGQIRNAGSVVVGGAAGYLPEKVKEYLPASVVGSTAPTTTLPSEEVGQNTSPKTRTAVGPLPGPPGEKDVAVLPDEKTSSSHTSTSHPTGTSTTFKPTLPSDELGHSPSTHTATGPLPSGEGVAIPPAQRTHDNATTGGMADLRGTSLARLPEETRLDGSRTGLPGYMGGLDHSSRGTKELSSAPTSFKDVHATSTVPHSGADSQASTRTLHGSIAERNEEREREKEKKGVVGETKDTLKKAEVKVAEKVPGVGSKDKNTSSTTDSRNANSSSTSGAGDGLTAAAAGSTVAGAPYPAKTTGPSGITTASHGPDATRRDFTSTTTSGEPSKDSKHTGAMGEQRYDTHASSSQASSVPPSVPPKSSSSNTSPTTTSASEAKADPAERRASVDSGKKEKHGFMDKLRGEVKVLSGKLGHDEEKIEEGRRMMGKN